MYLAPFSALFGALSAMELKSVVQKRDWVTQRKLSNAEATETAALEIIGIIPGARVLKSFKGLTSA